MTGICCPAAQSSGNIVGCYLLIKRSQVRFSALPQDFLQRKFISRYVQTGYLLIRNYPLGWLGRQHSTTEYDTCNSERFKKAGGGRKQIPGNDGRQLQNRIQWDDIFGLYIYLHLKPYIYWQTLSLYQPLANNII